MKIVSVLTTTARGGAEFAAVELLDGLVGRGHEAVLLTNQPDLTAGTAVHPRRLELGPKLARRSWVHIALRSPLYASRLRAALASEAPYDVLLLHYKKEQLIGAVLRDELRAATVWAEWGPLPTPLRRGIPRQLYRLAARRASLVVAVSANTRDSLVEVGLDPARIDVVPNILDVETLRFDPQARQRLRGEWGVPDDAFVVGCISRFHPAKRNDVVIDALDHLPGVVVILAGDGDHEPELRAQAARFGDRVRFLPTPRGYVHEVLSACDAQVFAASPREGSPRSIGFGQLAERPVISTAHVGAIDEMILPGMGAVISPPNDPRALAVCLAEYRDDPARRAAEGAAGRRHALARHGPDGVLGLVEGKLESLLAGAR